MIRRNQYVTGNARKHQGRRSVANAKLLGSKEIESAFVAADILEAAHKGINQFDKKPIKNLRALAALPLRTAGVSGGAQH